MMKHITLHGLGILRAGLHLFTFFQLDMNGVYSFSVDLENLHDLGQEYQFPQLEGAILHVEATVRETYTGKSQTTIGRNTVFASSPYVVKFPRSSKYFKPGLPYVVRVSSEACTVTTPICLFSNIDKVRDGKSKKCIPYFFGIMITVNRCSSII